MEPQQKRVDTGGLLTAFNQGEIASALKEVIQPGKTINQDLMRTVIANDRWATWFVVLLNLFDENDCKEEIDLLQHLLESKVSVGARGRDDLVTSIIGQREGPMRAAKRAFSHLSRGKYEDGKME